MFIEDEPTDDLLIGSLKDQIEAMRAGVRRVAPGSPAARDWDKFWKVYSGTIRGIGRAAGLQDADLDELESDVRLALLKCLPKYHRNGRRGSFRAWLHKLVSRKAIDMLRRKKRHPTVSLAKILDDGDEPIDSSADPARLYERSWSAAFVQSVLELFRAADPDIRLLEMRVLDSRTIEEIAAECNLPPRHVSIRICRVKERVRKAMEYFMGGGD